MRHHAAHQIICNVPPERVYGLIRHSVNWPRLLEPCQSVTVLDADADHEHIEISATVNGQTMSWQSRRRFQPEAFGVDAELVQPMPLVALNAEQSVLLLEHDYRLLDDVTGLVPGVHTHQDAAAFIARAIDANSTTELANLRAAAERVEPPDRRDFHARHTVVCSAPADEVYQLVRDTSTWPLIFDACVGARVVERDGDVEVVRIEARQDGRTVAWDTRRTYYDAIRRVDYELPVPMPLTEAMRGQWRVIPLAEDRCVLTVDRWWRILPDVRGIKPGIDTVPQAAAFVQRYVGDNATAEMVAIKALVEHDAQLLVRGCCGGSPLAMEVASG
jgi:aromatase